MGIIDLLLTMSVDPGRYVAESAAKSKSCGGHPPCHPLRAGRKQVGHEHSHTHITSHPEKAGRYVMEAKRALKKKTRTPVHTVDNEERKTKSESCEESKLGRYVADSMTSLKLISQELPAERNSAAVSNQPQANIRQCEEEKIQGRRVKHKCTKPSCAACFN